MSHIKYVVLVKPPDDHPATARIMGLFHSKPTAQAFADSITRELEKDVLDETYGYAYVMFVERSSKRRALAWARTGERLA